MNCLWLGKDSILIFLLLDIRKLNKELVTFLRPACRVCLFQSHSLVFFKKDKSFIFYIYKTVIQSAYNEENAVHNLSDCNAFRQTLIKCKYFK